MIDYTSPPATKLENDSLEIYSSLISLPLAILCGRNNSGKSFILRKLLKDIGRSASYLGPARYQNFNLLGAINPDKDRKKRKWDDLVRTFQNSNQNVDNSPWNLAQAIAELSDSKRELLLKLLNSLLGANTEIKYTVPDNSMSQKYVCVDNYNLSYTSSGFRLVATLLTSLLDSDYSHFLIDEPELGLSPEIQGVLSDLILNESIRKEYFPHIKSVILATHSPVFLDRKNIKNNFIIHRSDSQISVKQIKTIQELNSLQFFLLGNRFETLYLPSVIVIVEGTCDYEYLNRLIAIKYPNSQISIIRCDGDGRVRDVVNIIRQTFMDIQCSPYSDRIFIVLDSIHGKGIVDQISKMGIIQENIIVWESNGIEYVYPKSILEQRFGKFENLEISGDDVTANGISVRKKDLVEYVVKHLTQECELPNELTQKLLKRLEMVLF